MANLIYCTKLNRIQDQYHLSFPFLSLTVVAADGFNCPNFGPLFFGFFYFPLFEVVGLEIELNVADVGGRGAVPPHGARVPHRVGVHLGRDSAFTPRKVLNIVTTFSILFPLCHQGCVNFKVDREKRGSSVSHSVVKPFFSGLPFISRN